MIALFEYLDGLEEIPYGLVGAIGLAENLVGDEAFKPLDIYTAANGKTVEIHHTDAEGRLILADVMAYAEKTYAPESLVTIATLTGACIAALGYDYAGIMGDDEKMIRKIENASPFEKFWRLPLDKRMIDSVKAEEADLKNISKGMKAGSSLGAAFLTHFVKKAKYTHIDIAGPSYRPGAFSIFPKGGTGFGVLALAEVFSKK